MGFLCSQKEAGRAGVKSALVVSSFINRLEDRSNIFESGGESVQAPCSPAAEEPSQEGTGNGGGDAIELLQLLRRAGIQEVGCQQEPDLVSVKEAPFPAASGYRHSKTVGIGVCCKCEIEATVCCKPGNEVH